MLAQAVLSKQALQQTIGFKKSEMGVENTYRLDRRQGFPATEFILQLDLIECRGSRGHLSHSLGIFLLLSIPFDQSLRILFLGLGKLAILINLSCIRVLRCKWFDGSPDIEDKVFEERLGFSRIKLSVLVDDGWLLLLLLLLLLRLIPP